MSLPMRRVPVSREGLYNVLALLKRHKARPAVRAVRFELEPGQPVVIVLEPWEQRIVLHDTPYTGPRAETIRTWGRDRLRVLARLLPLVDGAEVYLLGHRLAELLVGADGRDAAAARPVRLDRQRLDRRQCPRPARAARGAEHDLLGDMAALFKENGRH